MTAREMKRSFRRFGRMFFNDIPYSRSGFRVSCLSPGSSEATHRITCMKPVEGTLDKLGECVKSCIQNEAGSTGRVALEGGMGGQIHDPGKNVKIEMEE